MGDPFSLHFVETRIEEQGTVGVIRYDLFTSGSPVPADSRSSELPPCKHGSIFSPQRNCFYGLFRDHTSPRDHFRGSGPPLGPSLCPRPTKPNQSTDLNRVAVFSKFVYSPH